MFIKLGRRFVDHQEESLQFRFVGIVRYIPLIVCGGFFALTIGMFAFGPLDWQVTNPEKLYGFLLLYLIALVLGYVLAIKNGKAITSKIKLNSNYVLIIGSLLYFVLYIPTLLETTGKWYPDIYAGLINSGEVYRTTAYLGRYGSHVIQYIRILLSPIMLFVIPLTLLFMPKLSTPGKVMGILVIILSFMLGISQGINKVCADITAQIVLVLIILLFSNVPMKSRVLYRIKIIGIILIICSLFFGYYSIVMRNRVASDISGQTMNEVTNNAEQQGFSDPSIPEEDIDKSVVEYSRFGTANIKQNSVILKCMPDNLEPTALFLFSYLTHGYKGMSIALDQEFTSSYGLGFSDFFRRNIYKLPGLSDIGEQSVYERTYMAKTSRMDWDTGAVWSTFFIYPASDISFPGTIILVFLIGYLFALSWKDALVTENPFAIVVFSGFCIMIFYFSANNQLFQSGENAFGYTVILLSWLCTRLISRKKQVHP